MGRSLYQCAVVLLYSANVGWILSIIPPEARLPTPVVYDERFQAPEDDRTVQFDLYVIVVGSVQQPLPMRCATVQLFPPLPVRHAPDLVADVWWRRTATVVCSTYSNGKSGNGNHGKIARIVKVTVTFYVAMVTPRSRSKIVEKVAMVTMVK